MTVSPLTVDGVTSDAVTLFVERAGAVRPGFGIFDEQTADAVIRICRTLDGLPLGHRAGRGPDGGDERGRGGRPAGRTLAPAAPDPSWGRTVRRPCGTRWRGPTTCWTTRNARLLRAAAVFVGGFDLPALVRRRRGERRRRGAAAARLVGAQVAGRRRPRLRARPGTASSRRSGQFVDDRAGGAAREREAARERHASYFADEAVRSMGALERPRAGATQVDWVRARARRTCASAYRWSLDRGRIETATDIAAHAALMGFSVELFETIGVGRGRCSRPRAEPTSARLPRLYAAAGYACFVGRAEAAAANAHRATELEAEARLRARASPATRRSSRPWARSTAAHLDRYVELTRAVAALPGRPAGLRDRRVRRRAAVGGTRRGGAAR